MSDPSPFISNGTCYYAAGEKSVSEVLACGNGALGTKNCCYPGDMCLEDSYCFAHVGNFTYIGGCTDPAYEDAACNKGKGNVLLPTLTLSTIRAREPPH